MKRAIVLSACLALLLAGCGNKDNSSAPSSVGDMIGGAVDNAISSVDEGLERMNVRTGLGMSIDYDSSAAATTEKAGLVQANISSCALTIDNNGTIVAVVFDTAQSKVNFDAAGAITTDLSAGVQTKKELGDSYGLKAASGIGKEWYEQIAALEKWMTGKTVDEVLGMKVYEKDADHPRVPDEEDLKSSVTISIGPQLDALKKAYDSIK